MAISARRKMASAVWPLPYLAGTAYRAGLKTSRRIDGDHHAEEDNGGGIVRDDVVDMAGFSGKARHHEIPETPTISTEKARIARTMKPAKMKM